MPRSAPTQSTWQSLTGPTACSCPDRLTGSLRFVWADTPTSAQSGVADRGDDQGSLGIRRTRAGRGLIKARTGDPSSSCPLSPAGQLPGAHFARPRPIHLHHSAGAVCGVVPLGTPLVITHDLDARRRLLGVSDCGSHIGPFSSPTTSQTVDPKTSQMWTFNRTVPYRTMRDREEMTEQMCRLSPGSKWLSLYDSTDGPGNDDDGQGGNEDHPEGS
jgi:hypothetical protein